MMGYLDQNEKISEDSGSVKSQQDEDMNDVGEVILETDGELHDSQKELKLEDEGGDQKILSQKNSQENLMSPDGKSTKKLSSAILSARNRKLSCN